MKFFLILKVLNPLTYLKMGTEGSTNEILDFLSMHFNRSIKDVSFEKLSGNKDFEILERLKKEMKLNRFLTKAFGIQKQLIKVMEEQIFELERKLIAAQEEAKEKDPIKDGPI